jgi:tetratricopeptide (TPR) repeat protein
MDIFSFNRGAEIRRAISPGELYQHLASEIIKGFHRKEALSQFGNDLINLAEHAYSLRQMETLEHISQVLLNLPLAREYRSIAHYFQAYCIKRSGQFFKARSIFERVADEAPLRYRARAMAALGSIAFDRGEYQSVLPLYIEGRRIASHGREFDPLAEFYTQHMMAVMRSIDGDNHGALEDLEKMSPLVRAISSTYPPIYCNYLNSLAVELAEVGRLEEAARACRITLAPSFANAYPEVRETWDDIVSKGRRASRSFVSFAQRNFNTENVLQLPVPDHSLDPAGSPLAISDQPARVLDYLNWIKKMGKKPNGDQKDNQEELSDRQMVMKIMEYATESDLPDEVLHKILDAVRQIVEDYRKKKS